jgi:hypothetical protein
LTEAFDLKLQLIEFAQEGFFLRLNLMPLKIPFASHEAICATKGALSAGKQISSIRESLQLLIETQRRA